MKHRKTLSILFGICVWLLCCSAVPSVGDWLTVGNATFAQETVLKTRQRMQRSRAKQILDSLSEANDRTILIAAHRGGYTHDRQDKAPENSLANIEIAVAKGYEVFETDIQRTIDSVFVIVHDPTLDRETNGTGPADALTIEQLKRLRKRYRDGSLSDHPVATLREFLEAGKDRILFKADLKPGLIEHFDPLARLIAKHPAGKQVFLRTGIEDADAIERCFAAGTPKVEVMFKVDTASQVKNIHQRFAPATIQINIAKGEMLSDSKREAIRAARKLGILVETHVFNSAQQTTALLDAGVRMLHTNDPDDIREFVQRRSRKSESDAD